MSPVTGFLHPTWRPTAVGIQGVSNQMGFLSKTPLKITYGATKLKFQGTLLKALFFLIKCAYFYWKGRLDLWKGQTEIAKTRSQQMQSQEPGTWPSLGLSCLVLKFISRTKFSKTVQDHKIAWYNLFAWTKSIVNTRNSVISCDQLHTILGIGRHGETQGVIVTLFQVWI